jgi:transposase
MALAEKQLEGLERALVAQLPDKVQARIGHLQKLKGVGAVGSVRLVLELFWRDFHNRREVGACVGLVPQPYDSGESHVDQGISKQGNRRVRALLIEMAWMWLRYQPESALSRWFAQRTQGNGPNKRGKRIAIVAVARRLVISLWRYLENGVVPDGALMKA